MGYTLIVCLGSMHCPWSCKYQSSGDLLNHTEIVSRVVLKILVLSTAIFGTPTFQEKTSGDRRQSSNVFGLIKEIFAEI